MIVGRAARLICTTQEFDDLAKEVGLGSHKERAMDKAERVKLRAELDGLVAHLYELNEEEFTHILSTFPIVEQSIKDAALEAYRSLIPKSTDQKLASLIAGGENRTVEFKSSARWDMQQNKHNKTLENIIVKTVASLLNSEGGNLLIGVDDDGKIIGLENDYKTLGKKQSRDGFENWLTTLLLNQFGKDCSPQFSITFHRIENMDICQVLAKQSPKPVYVKINNEEHLFIRAGNSTRQLTTREAVEYCNQRWK